MRAPSFQLIGAALRLCVAFSLLALLLVGALRAFSPPSAQAQAFAAYAQSGDCTPDAPCLLGIRPGVTTISEAYALLEDHPWIAAVDLYVDFNALAWSWSGAQPDWIAADIDGALWVYRNIVQYVRIPTRLTLGDLALLHTPATLRRAASYRVATDYIAEFAAFDADGRHTYRIETLLSCQLSAAAFWRAPIRLNLPTPDTPLPLDPTIPANWIGERALCAYRG